MSALAQSRDTFAPSAAFLAIRCCGGDAVLAYAPGHEGERAPGDFRVERDVPTRAWCRECWSRQFRRTECNPAANPATN